MQTCVPEIRFCPLSPNFRSSRGGWWGGCRSGTLPDFFLRPYHTADRPALWRLLNFLPALYPGGGAWLDRRLVEVEAEKASCDLIVTGRTPVAVAIQTPKGARKLKLCTLYVAPRWRSARLGTALLAHVRLGWILAGMREAHVTVDTLRAPALERILLPAGFRRRVCLPDRYGAARSELVFTWEPATDSLVEFCRRLADERN